jgi:23S rRNA (uridine2552-2'-O)-methyltransferase
MTRKTPGRNKAKTRVYSARKRKSGSTRWLERQLNDPYVHKAKMAGYRSRAAFKLLEMDERLNLLSPGMAVIDLGAAPGGWSQVAAAKGCRVVAIDLLAMDPIPDVNFLQMDFLDPAAPDALKAALGTPADIVLSDIAPNTIGHRQTDHLRIMAAVEAAFMFACEVLRPDGVFIAKVFQGGAQNTMLSEIKLAFRNVKHIKPPASRADSSEQYIIASGFRGTNPYSSNSRSG